MKSKIKILKSLSILIVEDEDQLRKIMKSTFDGLKCITHFADNGLRGLAAYSCGSYDLILTDINMPIMNGQDMIKEIRSKDADIAIIVMSAYTDENYVSELNKLKVNGFVNKPFDFIQFINMVHDIMK